jgi:hypothetical protein
VIIAIVDNKIYFSNLSQKKTFAFAKERVAKNHYY